MCIQIKQIISEILNDHTNASDEAIQSVTQSLTNEAVEAIADAVNAHELALTQGSKNQFNECAMPNGTYVKDFYGDARPAYYDYQGHRIGAHEFLELNGK